jgi:hypothetical protein
VSLFSTPLATTTALSFPPIAPRNEIGVDFLDGNFMALCSDGPSAESSFFLTPCVLYIFQLAMYQIDIQSALVAPLVASNAVWVIGEYCLAIGAGPMTDKLVQPLACQLTGLLQHVMTVDGESINHWVCRFMPAFHRDFLGVYHVVLCCLALCLDNSTLCSNPLHELTCLD